MNFWITLPAGVRGFVRGVVIAVVFSALDYVAHNVGVLGLSPFVAGLITAGIAAIENNRTSTAQSRLQ